MRVKSLDSTISQPETETGIAIFVGQRISTATPVLQDVDDACQQAGREFGNWVLHITDSEVFKATIKAVLGNGKFNEEFFLDGLREAVGTF